VTARGALPAAPASYARLESAAIVCGIAVFVGLEGAAMALYPGGTWWDATARGHRFWQNYLCDLEWRVALNGQPNPVGSWLAQGAMLVLVLTLAPFWLATTDLFAPSDARAGSAVRVCGLMSVGATLAVIFMPSERFGALHGAMVILACVPGFAAAALAVRYQLRGEPRARIAAPIGAATLAVSAVDLGLYASHLLAGVEGTVAVPTLEKVALLLLLSWLLVVAGKRVTV
jgi:hypothetical protein